MRPKARQIQGNSRASRPQCFTHQELSPIIPPSPYTRVSNLKGRASLDLAQQEALARFAEAEVFKSVDTFTKIEICKGTHALDKRPRLAAAGSCLMIGE